MSINPVMSWSMYSKIRCMPVASSSATQRRVSAVACVFQNDLQKQQNRAPHVRLLQTISLNLTMFRCDTSLSSLISRNTLSGTCSRLAVICDVPKRRMLKEANPVAFLAYFDALYGNLVSRLDMIRLIYGPSNFTQGKIVLHVRMQND